MILVICEFFSLFGLKRSRSALRAECGGRHTACILNIGCWTECGAHVYHGPAAVVLPPLQTRNMENESVPNVFVRSDLAAPETFIKKKKDER